MAVKLRRKKMIEECDGGAGGASFPMQTVCNTGGVGNAVPAQMAAMTAADQCNPTAIGSGDLFGVSSKMNTQSTHPKKRHRVKFKKRKK